MPEDEAGFIALHFVNAEYGTDIRDAVRFPNQVKEILGIVADELGIEMDEGSLHYERFLTHVKFLLQRIYRKELLEEEENEITEMMQRKYPRERILLLQRAHLQLRQLLREPYQRPMCRRAN